MTQNTKRKVVADISLSLDGPRQRSGGDYDKVLPGRVSERLRSRR